MPPGSILRVLIVFPLIASSMLLDIVGTATAAQTGPVNLTVEYADRPLGIDETRPRFAWLSQARRQTAYQIRVATSLAALQQSRGLVWNSGRVASSDNIQIEYAGPALQSRMRYFWQARVWDERGKASAWSDPSWWEMGLLEPSDWIGQWIGGRQNLDHDWADLKVTFDFTLNGTALNFLFRARPVGKTYGETYNWQITSVDGKPTLREQVRQYPGGGNSNTKVTTLKELAIPNIAPPDLVGKRHQIVIETQGAQIKTWIDGALIDTLNDGAQKAGAIGFLTSQANTAIIHQVLVEVAGKTVFQSNFANNANPFTGGDPTNEGLLVAAGAPGKDIVLPMAAPAPLLRKNFAVSNRKIEQARLYVAAGGWPKVALNGRKVGDTAIENGFTAYDKRVLYRTYDVTDLVRGGDNALGVELGRGWYGLCEPNEWYWHMAAWRGAPRLRAQLEITFAGGGRETVNTDGSWRTIDGPTTYDSIYGGEHYDARLAPNGWRNEQYNDSAWANAVVVDGPKGELAAAQLEPIKVVGEIKPVAIKQPKPGIYVFDFGRIFAGWAQLNVSGARGLTVSLVHTEKLNADGTVAPEQRLIDTQIQTDYYTLAGGATEQWEPSFSYKGFRYAQVEGFPGEPALDALIGKIVHSSMASIGNFETSNDLLNKIQQAARNTLLNNTHGFVTDTPTYEKNGWTGDAQASSLAAALNFDMARVWTKWLADFRDAQSPTGEMPEIVPATEYYGFENTPGWNMIWGPTPPWDVATFVLPWDMYINYGDTRILERMYETQKKLVDYTGRFITAANNYTYNRGLGEYAAQGPVGPTDATTVAYYYFMVDRLAKSAEILGRKADAAAYRELASKIREAYNARYWDARQEIYRAVNGDGTSQPYAQTQNALPLAFGMVPAGQEHAVARHLNEDIVAKKRHLTTGVFAARYLMTILSDYGYTDTAFAVATQTTQPSWGYWITNGHATMFEGWGLNSRSHDHHYWALISSWFYQSLAGIRPGEPGFKTLIIKPHAPKGLDQAHGSIKTARGLVESGWRRGRDGKFELRVTIPSNMPSEVWVPTGGKRAATEPAGAAFVRLEDGFAVYRVGAGAYTFNSQ